jgi:hypothetical protein
MEKFKKLSREELKNTFGGRSCKLVVPNGNGGYTTYTGTCDNSSTSTYDSLSNSFYVTIGQNYCNIGDGVVRALASNGGNSRC